MQACVVGGHLLSAALHDRVLHLQQMSVLENFQPDTTLAEELQKIQEQRVRFLMQQIFPGTVSVWKLFGIVDFPDHLNMVVIKCTISLDRGYYYSASSGSLIRAPRN